MQFFLTFFKEDKEIRCKVIFSLAKEEDKKCEESLKNHTADSDNAIVLPPSPSKIQWWLYKDKHDEFPGEWKRK